ncbi:dTDP-4-dehydrorhamnose 3,5-epimerase [candidate division LCP-89 bacterium B3_LCP]|uniref:dTDP-4-dehydrorhamnose 3,5-epimerase n=1 Tax=candidate division LCP-89 bacterium B3_LCP TaxID=2012998 RepID=A0A532V1C0_UNCL8|nr:MAG: dTDP-4-dehydrorhamnose 3,5-epimerase [candidate division LCP-89 bacterium B3_LCP]
MQQYEKPVNDPIDGVVIKDLKVIPDERGRLMEILRSDEEPFEKFGQVYMTSNYPDVVKGWHYHKKQSDNVACVRGMIKLVLFDGRDDSPTKDNLKELFIGEHNPKLVHIPAGVWHGWKGIGEVESLTINIPTEVFNREEPDEYRLPFDTDEIPYDWNIKMG